MTAEPRDEASIKMIPHGSVMSRARLSRPIHHPGRVSILFVLLALAVFLPACRPVSPLPELGSINAFLQEAESYAQARQRSLELRKGMEGIAKAIYQEPSTDVLQSLRLYKREYFAMREILLSTAMLHATAIVEQPDRQSLDSLLLRTSLALMAGTALVQNFHMVAPSLHDQPALRAVWNEPDLEYGIPAGSWEISLQTYRTAHYQDLFRVAIEKLKAHRRDLENHLRVNNKIFLALYPQGIEPALREADETYTLLRAGFAAEDLSLDERELRALVDRSKKLRSEWKASAPLLRQAIARDRGLIRGNVHVRIHAAKREYLELREALYHLAFKHVSKLTRQDIAYSRSFRLRAIGISLLAAVTLYENAHQLETQILTIPGVKALLNQGDPALGIPRGFWDNIESEFNKVEYRSLLEAGIQVLEQEQVNPAASGIEEDPFLAYVTKEISTSAAIAEIRGEGFLGRMSRGLRRYAEQTQTIGMGTLSMGKFQFSRGFGNLVGMIEFRKGKLFNQPHWVHFVKERLQPGDLLLEKTPFKLTDKLIPGHFGHVAMYVGTEAQIRELGLWDHPGVAKYRKEIGEERVVVEALRDGTQINTIERFLNIDDLAILRPKRDKIPQAEVIQAITLAFSHIGKRYDFDFDNNTWDTIVCSELAFHTYVNVRWPFTKMLSSYTISPDDIAVVGGSDPSRPFDLIAFIHNGQIIHDQPTRTLNERQYILFLGGRYEEASRQAARR